MRAVSALVRKDLLLELRTKETVPAMALFALVAYVLFHFALHRNALEGDLAAGVLWVTILLAAVLGVNRLFVAEREQGGFDGFLLAPVDRTAMLAAKVTALLCFLVVLELIAVPAFFLLLLGPSAGPAFPELLLILVLADIGLAVVGTLAAGLAVQTRARDLIGPLVTLPLLVPVVLAAARATSPLFSAPRAAWRPSGWPCWACTIWCSYSWRTPSSTSSWRTDLLHGKGLRGLSIATAATLSPPSPSSSSTRPWTPIRASCRRSSTCTSRWRSWPCAASSSAGSAPSDSCARATASGTCVYVAIHLSLILGVGVLITGSIWRAPRGGTGGCGTSRRWSRS